VILTVSSRIAGVVVVGGLAVIAAACETSVSERHSGQKPAPPPGLFDTAEGEIEQNPVRKQAPIRGGADETGGEPPSEAQIFEGSGQLLGRGDGKAEVEERQGKFTMNFAEAELARVLETVLGEMLERNYTVDPELQARITARSARPLAREDVLPALEDMLAVHGIALVEASSGMLRVVPVEDANTAAPVLVGPEAGQDGFGVHIIPVDYVSADALIDTLEPFVAPGRGLQADAARNLLLFRGPGSEARDITAMIESFDVDWMQGMSFALLPLAHADVSSVVGELDAIFGQGGEAPEAMQGVVRFLPVERMNAVLVISEQPEYVYRAEEWVKRLDRGGGAEGERQLYVYHLKRARAGQVAKVLGQIFDVRSVGGDGGGAGNGEVALGRESATASNTAGGGSGSGGQDGGRGGASRAGGQGGTGQGGGSGGGQSAPSGGQVQVGQPGAGTGGRAGSGGLLGSEQGDGPRIIADQRNDAMIILATAREYDMIESTLDRLDISPLQVLIEATIAEVTLNDQLRYGLRYAFDASSGDNTNQLTFSDLPGGTVGEEFPGFSYLFDSGDARVTLSALDEITDVTVVSSPQLMVLDNQSARLQVGDQVPVPVQQSVATQDPDAPIVNSIQFEDTGVILNVTPHVNASGQVVLDVTQEVSDVVQTTSSGIDAPTIQQREITSSVAVQTGETIALGGLIQDRSTDTETGIPLLMQIPWLGNLFKSRTISNERTELLVLLTPKVVRDPGEARAVTKELRRRLQGLDRIRRNFDLEQGKTPGDTAPAGDGAPNQESPAEDAAGEPPPTDSQTDGESAEAS